MVTGVRYDEDRLRDQLEGIRRGVQRISSVAHDPGAWSPVQMKRVKKTRNDAKNRVKTYLRMSLHDRHPSRPMRFLRHQPQKVLWILWGSRIYGRISFPFSSGERSSR